MLIRECGSTPMGFSSKGSFHNELVLKNELFNVLYILVLPLFILLEDYWRLHCVLEESVPWAERERSILLDMASSILST